MNFPKTLILSMLALVAFSCSSVKPNEETEQAERIVKKDIVNATSQEFFDKYFSFVREKHYTDNDGAVHVFALENIAPLEIADTLEFVVLNGRAQNFDKQKGIPDCVVEPQNCVFAIDKRKLLEILTEKKLLEPKNEFIAKAIWRDDEKRFLWKATITKERIETLGIPRAKGLYVFVNPATGEIIEVKKWEVR